MTGAASLAWFARHELRLVWRDWVSMMTAGKQGREPVVVLGLVVVAILLHLLAYALVAPLAAAGIAADQATLALVMGSLLLSASMMLSQAMESVTRAFYTRADLDLILSSPASARRVFAIRIGAVALSTFLLSALLAGPFVNALAFYDGPRWLAAYGLLLGLAALTAALAVALTVALFRTLGPRRTRLTAQIVAAAVGAAFVIGVQAAAILSTGSLSRLSLFRSEAALAVLPGADSALWLPARAAFGDPVALALVLALGLGLLGLSILAFAGRFGDHAMAAAGVDFGPRRSGRRADGFRRGSTKRTLRRKEWTLLLRDPWLVSQTLMQILYLLPPALLLWRHYGEESGALLILVPVLVMAAGQLAGALAWLAISGEDAPDLVATAPVGPRALTAAKIEAVLGAIGFVTLPLLAALALAVPWLGLVAALGVAVSAASATMIQLWFRAQAKRSAFRRRQTSSRVATLAEALCSILWAATAGLAAAQSWFAAAPAILALLVLAVTRAISPRKADGD